jgi:uncharacterized protein YndB with AHSA1/START domain
VSPATSPEAVPGSVGGPGLLQVDRENASVEFRRLLRHPIEEVWKAITDPEQLEQWFMVKVSRDPATGRIEMWHATGVRATGQLLQWDPPRVYEYEWSVAPGSALPDGEESVVRFELSSVPEGTLLVLTHRKLTRRTAQVFARGLKTYLDRLSALVDGTPLPDAAWLTGAPRPEPTDRSRRGGS